MVTPSFRPARVRLLSASWGGVAGRQLAFSLWDSDQPGPRELSRSLVTIRSPSFRFESAPIRAMSGSEPGTTRSSSLNVRSGAYSGPLDLRDIPHARSTSPSRRGSSSGGTSRMRAWG